MGPLLLTAARLLRDGIELRVKVQPRSRRPGIGGASPEGALRVAVTEAPEDGRANHAVCRAVADALGVPGSAVELAQGAASRLKLLRVAGDPARLSERIGTLLA
ncbi:DUF167 domain-containing protein [Falsiroseomonas sp. HW251]|uniref:DUF167 domain-containing protein n=1 Tax=Falsiroseomonas sp. HW251 TaxID=3390998 RepID=UPI003D30F2F4